LKSLQEELGTVLSLSSTGLLSGTLSEEETRTLKRLIEETGEVSEEVRKYIDELEEIDKRLDEMKKSDI
jgi:NTP pyrophosphatase (non-canonical NTP hydrolase)